LKTLIKKLTSTAIVPTRATTSSAGMDLYADLESPITIESGQIERIPTGIAIALPKGTFGAIYARSGLATKRGLRPGNCVGVIDSDYRGELIVALYNDSSLDQTVYPKDRIAQLVIMPYVETEFTEVEDLGNTSRGLGGFGSTGQ
jgi:dUTP pyrophosphatase